MSNLFAELKRRNVVRVGIAYVVVAWIIMQILDVIVEPLLLPDWTATLVLVLLAIGFPITMLFSWAFELTPQGLKKTAEVDADESITPSTGRKLDFIIIGALVLGLGYFVWESRFAEKGDRVEAEQTAEKSIAVLPFANMSGDAENAQFTNGLHDDLLTQLAKNRELKVISRTSVLEYRDTTKNMRTIGQELGVTSIMEGGVQRAGNRVRINVQLIDTATDKHLWAETYDRELSLENIFDIQSEIARNIATALKATLGEAADKAEFKAPTQNMAAYEAYLAGRLAMEIMDFSLESFVGARAHFETAIAEDPGFALAWAELTGVNDAIYWWVDRSDENRQAFKLAAEKALALDPELPQAHYAMASYFYHGLLDYDRALAELSIAEKGMAGTSPFHMLRGAVLRRSGNIEASAIDWVTAAELDPKNFIAQLDAVNTLYGLRRFSEGDARTERFPDTPEYRSAYSLQKPASIYQRSGDPAPMLEILDRLEDRDLKSFISSDGYFFLLLEVGRLDDALALLERDAWTPWRDFDSYLPKDYFRAHAVFATDPEAAEAPLKRALAGFEARLAVAPDNEDFYADKSLMLALMGDHDAAVAAARRAIEIWPLEKDAWGGVSYIGNLATVLAIVGRHEEAIEVLDRYLPLPNAFSLRTFMNFYPVKGLEDHPGFAALVEKHGWVQKERASK